MRHFIGTSIEDIRKIPRSKLLFLFPYCVKDVNCPATRRSDNCLPSCNLCSVSSLLKALDRLRIDHYVIIDDNALSTFLKENRGNKEVLLGCGCKLSMRKFLSHVTDELNYKGIAFEIHGDTCGESEYKEVYRVMMHQEPKQTYIDLSTILKTLKELYG